MNSLGNWNNTYASLRNFQETPSILERVWISLPKIRCLWNVQYWGLVHMGAIHTVSLMWLLLFGNSREQTACLSNLSF